jgi:hypothetical protein
MALFSVRNLRWPQFSSVLKGIFGERGITLTVPITWTGYTKKELPRVGNYKYFSDEEVAGLDKELCAKLDMARDKAGVPFFITSGKRSAEENAKLNGAVSDSAHMAGLAVDLATGSDHVKNRVIYGLCVAGLGDRIGEYFTIDPAEPNRLVPHHIHVDIDTTKPQQVTWATKEQN